MEREHVQVVRSFCRAASPTLTPNSTDVNLYRTRKPADFIKVAVAVLAFLATPLHSAAESNGSLSRGTSKPSYSVTALPDTYAFAPTIPSGSQETQGLAWLDDHRVMFVGFRPGSADSKGLYVWNVAANTVSQYSTHTEFCFADGYISAVGPSKRRADGTSLSPVRQGLLGQEQDNFCDTRTGKGCRGRLNMSCTRSTYFGKAGIGEYSRYVFELRSGDGAIVDPVDRLAILDQLRNKNLEEKKALFSQPLLLVSERFPRGKPLPITALEEVTVWKATYSKFGNQYVFLTERPKNGIPGYTTIWPQGVPQPVYAMTRAGDVERADIPTLATWNKINLASLATPGIVFKGSGSRQNDWGGLFLFDKRAVWQLDRGKTETFAVSDNGCHVVYAIDNEFGKRRISFRRIKAIHFC